VSDNPHAVLVAFFEQFFPDRTGMARHFADGVLHALSEAKIPIDTPAELPSRGQRQELPKGNYRVDRWTDDGNSIETELATLNSFPLAQSCFEAAVKEWPKARITLRQGAHKMKEHPGSPLKRHEV